MGETSKLANGFSDFWLQFVQKKKKEEKYMPLQFAYPKRFKVDALSYPLLFPKARIIIILSFQ